MIRAIFSDILFIHEQFKVFITTYTNLRGVLNKTCSCHGDFGSARVYSFGEFSKQIGLVLAIRM